MSSRGFHMGFRKLKLEAIVVILTNLAERQSKVSSDALEILIEIFCDSENEKKYKSELYALFLNKSVFITRV